MENTYGGELLGEEKRGVKKARIGGGGKLYPPDILLRDSLKLLAAKYAY